MVTLHCQGLAPFNTLPACPGADPHVGTPDPAPPVQSRTCRLPASGSSVARASAQVTPCVLWPAREVGLRRSRSDLSAMRVLAGRRVAVKTCPLGWACPTAESDARDDSPTADGGLSLAPDSSPCRARVPPRASGPAWGRGRVAPAGPQELETLHGRWPRQARRGHGRRRLSAGRPRPADMAALPRLTMSEGSV